MRTPKRSWFICLHALERMTRMELTRADVVGVLDDAELDYPSERGRRTAVRGRLAVAYDPATRTVVTVLWHGATSRNAA